VAAQTQLDRIDAKVHARTNAAGAADARAGQERPELAVRQRGVVHAMPDGDGLARDVLEQLAPDVVRELVERLRIGAVGGGVAHRAALERDDVQPASVSSLAMIAPAQPKPTITTSAFFIVLPAIATPAVR
jgi:hypothetical protein